MKEIDFRNAKEGDTVYKLTPQGFIKGIIREMYKYPNPFYPIAVEFIDDPSAFKYELYTLAGQGERCKAVTLFWNPFDIPERPKKKVQKTIDYWCVINTANNSIESFLEKRLAEDFMYEKMLRTTNVYTIVPQTVTYEEEE